MHFGWFSACWVCFDGCRCTWRAHIRLKPTSIQSDRTVFDVREVIFSRIVPLSNQIIALCLLWDQLWEAPFLLAEHFFSFVSSHRPDTDKLRSHLKFRAKMPLMRVGEGISALNTLVFLLDTRNRLCKQRAVGRGSTNLALQSYALLSTKWLFRAQLTSDRRLHFLYRLHMFDRERNREKRARCVVLGKWRRCHKRIEMRHLMSVIFGRCIAWLLSLMFWSRQTMIWIGAGKTSRTGFPLVSFPNVSKHFYPSVRRRHWDTSPLPKESNSVLATLLDTTPTN